ncbi:MAG: zinc-dependent peptidase [Mariprofundus sp.]
MNWLRRRLFGRSLRKGGIPAHLWFQLERTLPLLSRYEKREQWKLRMLASSVLAKKHFTGVQGMLLTPLQEATLATQIAIVVFAWFQSFEGAFEQINEQINMGFQTPLNTYAATNPAEFFAVASEYFFEAPDVLKEAYPKVYEQLCLFYRQNFCH